MSNTLTMLLAVHRAPMVRLADICEHYFNCDAKAAYAKAALNRLPVPAWRLIDSRKAPLMVRLLDLAEYIDNQGDVEKARWAKSQI